MTCPFKQKPNELESGCTNRCISGVNITGLQICAAVYCYKFKHSADPVMGTGKQLACDVRDCLLTCALVVAGMDAINWTRTRYKAPWRAK